MYYPDQQPMWGRPTPTPWGSPSIPNPNRSIGYNPYSIPQSQMVPSQPIQPQPQQMMAQPNYIPGRIISTIDETIAPNEIPMDGTVSLFPTSDFSAIVAKSWTKEGTIKPVYYYPGPDPTSKSEVIEGTIVDPSPNEILANIIDRLSNIETLLNSFKPQTQQTVEKKSTTKSVPKEEK